jgi:hypothetical protein
MGASIGRDFHFALYDRITEEEEDDDDDGRRQRGPTA